MTSHYHDDSRTGIEDCSACQKLLGARGPDERVRRVTAYLSVYETWRAYGGPEEGGWWYDAYDHQASVPYEAWVTFEYHEEPDPEMGLDAGWRPTGVPRPVDEEWHLTETKRLATLYGIDHDRATRYDGCWHTLVDETGMGDLGRRPRPRYE